MKLKGFYTAKDTIIQVKRQPTGQETSLIAIHLTVG